MNETRAVEKECPTCKGNGRYNTEIGVQPCRTCQGQGWFYVSETPEDTVLNVSALLRDARRWRALVGCARVRMIGCAGFHSSVNNPIGYRHLGVEMWSHHDTPDEQGPEMLTKFADQLVDLRLNKEVYDAIAEKEKLQ